MSKMPYREEIPYKVKSSMIPSHKRSEYWETGAALQACDGLHVSDYAREAARAYVSGAVSSSELVDAIKGYYDRQDSGIEGDRQSEADIVAARITQMLESNSFILAPSTLVAIHARLFDGVLRKDWVGRIRSENITKPEPVLGGRSANYMEALMIADALDYDFRRERSKAYRTPFDKEQVGRFSRFIAGVWQIHAFREGNTRTIATFSELYLRSMGIRVSDEPFQRNSVFFRDALVRASFSDLRMGVPEEYGFITAFFENVILGAKNRLCESDLSLHGARVDDTPYRMDVSVPAADVMSSARQVQSIVAEGTGSSMGERSFGNGLRNFAPRHL